MSRSEIEGRLAFLGTQRARADAEAECLASDIREAVASARGVIPMTEIARLLGMDRTSVYRTYVEAA